MKYVTCTALALVLFGTGCHFGTAPADFSKAPPTPAVAFIRQMRAKYHGDASRLTPEERQKMDKITRGNTQIAMKDTGSQ